MPLYLGREQKAKVNVSFKGGGAELPTLTNEGSAADLFSGKQLIDGEGNKVTGTFSIDNELSTQDNLITRIQTALEGKAVSGGDSGGSISYDTCTLQINNQSGYPYILGYTSVENGKIVAKYSLLSDSTSIICLCGSIFCCHTYGRLVSSSITYLGIIDGGISHSRAYSIDAYANETIIATIYDNGSGGGSID